MELMKSILMGLIQGILGFMPLSSSGHLILVEHIFHSDSGSAVLFMVMLHAAVLPAVIIVFSKDIANLVAAAGGIVIDILSNAGMLLMRMLGKKTKGYYIINSSPHRKFLISLAQTCVVAGLMGYGMKDVFHNAADNMIITGISFIINSIVILFVDRLPQGYKKIKNTNGFDAVIIGAVQGFAVIPGLSRMGLSVMAAMALGMEKSFALKYSLISSIPVIFGAFVLELTGAQGTSIGVGLMADYLAGMLVAAVTAVFCIRIVLGIIKKSRMTGFAVYGVFIGIFSIIMGLIK